MKALLFPGQGSQIVGMGKELHDKFDLVKRLFDEADNKLNYKISKIILEGPENELKLTKNTQPAILIVSYSIFKIIKNELNTNLNDVKFFAGHSLGEYSALVASDSLNFLDAIYLLHERGKSMQEAVPENTGSMLAVMGMKINELEILLSKLNSDLGICEIANDNSESQIIISGHKKAVSKIEEQLKNQKKKINFFTCQCTFPLFFDEACGRKNGKKN